MQIDYSGRPVKEIGVTIQQYQDALKVIQGYKDQLIKAGILKKEKTVQEIQEEQTAMIKALSEQIAQLKAEVKNNGEHATKSDKADA